MRFRMFLSKVRINIDRENVGSIFHLHIQGDRALEIMKTKTTCYWKNGFHEDNERTLKSVLAGAHQSNIQDASERIGHFLTQEVHRFLPVFRDLYSKHPQKPS